MIRIWISDRIPSQCHFPGNPFPGQVTVAVSARAAATRKHCLRMKVSVAGAASGIMGVASGGGGGIGIGGHRDGARLSVCLEPLLFPESSESVALSTDQQPPQD